MQVFSDEQSENWEYFCTRESKSCIAFGQVVLNGQDLVSLGTHLISNDVWIEISNSKSFSRIHFISPGIQVLIDVISPPLEWNVSRDIINQYMHLNLKIERVHLSEAVGGILGASATIKYDSDGNPILKSSDKDGAGILDGKGYEYEPLDFILLLSTLCVAYFHL